MTRSKVPFCRKNVFIKVLYQGLHSFLTKFNEDGLSFTRCNRLSESVVILYLTMTVCQGREVDRIDGCTVNHIFNKSLNRCIGEYTYLKSICIIMLYVVKRVQDFKCS